MKTSIFPFHALCALLLLAACTGTPEQSQTEDPALSVFLTPDVLCGTVQFEDGCSPSLDSLIRFGLALVHHMTYEDAEYHFDNVIAQDPDCFWGHWGKAMTYIHPLWPDEPSAEQMQQGRVSSQRAVSLATSEKEKLYGEAVAAYYTETNTVPKQERLKSFHEGWKAAHQALAGDIEASLFYGLTKLSTASPGDKTYAVQLEVGALAEGVLKQIPDHPGGYHYAIHAYDIPALAPKAIEVASNYGKIAPEIPHALHMPSHIFTRLGNWDESIHWNDRSAKAALRMPLDGKVSSHYFHALDYMVYAHLQKGEDREVEQILQQVVSLDDPFTENAATLYSLASMPARYALERQRWAEAGKLHPVKAADLQWNNWPAYEAIVHFARGIGAARSGDSQVASDAVSQMDSLLARIADNMSLAYWAQQIRIQKTAVQAWQAFAQDQRADALALMRTAAEMEAATEKHPISPGEILPIAELYGDMLLETGDAAGALVQYEQSLSRTPDRLNGLYGAGRAAEVSGNKELARKHFSRLVEVAGDGNAKLERIQHAKTVVKEM